MTDEEFQKLYAEAVKDKSKLVYCGHGIYATQSGLSSEEFDKMMIANGFVRLEDSRWMNMNLDETDD